jgi:hypothetical protein
VSLFDLAAAVVMCAALFGYINHRFLGLFKYAREVQPSPKLGEWIEPLTEIVEAESKLPKRERRSTQRLFEELRGRGHPAIRGQERPGARGL